jgi:hypothetical protein
MQGEGVHPVCEFFGQRRIDHPVALDPALAGESRCNDMDPEMGFTARPRAGIAGVTMGIIDDAKARRVERQRQFFLDA